VAWPRRWLCSSVLLLSCEWIAMFTSWQAGWKTECSRQTPPFPALSHSSCASRPTPTHATSRLRRPPGLGCNTRQPPLRLLRFAALSCAPVPAPSSRSTLRPLPAGLRGLEGVEQRACEWCTWSGCMQGQCTRVPSSLTWVPACNEAANAACVALPRAGSQSQRPAIQGLAGRPTVCLPAEAGREGVGEVDDARGFQDVSHLTALQSVGQRFGLEGGGAQACTVSAVGSLWRRSQEEIEG
jgi:hypothetical protein